MTMESGSNLVEISPEVAHRKSAGSRAAYPRKSHTRSRVSNGHDVLPNVDGRSTIARRYRDIASAMESKLANGEAIDIQEHATLSSTLVRLAQRIGIDRVPIDISPTLSDIAAEIEAGRQNKDAADA
jgi:hypothetical protein